MAKANKALGVVKSINTKVDLTIDATSFLGTASYGQIMIGDNGFEFYDQSNPKKNIQIPWNQVSYVIVSILFKGHWIPRYALRTKRSGTYSFSSKDPKRVLRAIRVYIQPERIVRSLTFWQVVKRAFTRPNRAKKAKKAK